MDVFWKETTNILMIIFSLTAHVRCGEETFTQEVCHLHNLNATCSDNQVIVVHEALYGRMEMNRCVKISLGYEGCQTDVLQELDKQCSGKQNCYYQVSHLHGQSTSYSQGCPDEIVSYLFIRYSCKEVLSCKREMCQSSDYLKVTDPSKGILASNVALASGCGSTSCPWVLEAKPGQRINLTLIDFWPRDNYDLDTNPFLEPLCPRYATISEDSYTSKDITSCGEVYQRESVIYQSWSNKVKVELYSSTDLDNNMQFLIKYEVINCPDMEAPPNTHVAREGDMLTVSCTDSNKEWHLVCQGVAWVGETGTCSDVTSTETGAHEGSSGARFGMLIVIGLGVALGVLIGIMLLAVVFLIMKRHRRRELLRRQRNLLADSSPGRDDIGNKMTHVPMQRSIGHPPGMVRYIPDHSFTATIQLKRPLPLPLEERHDFPLLNGTERCSDDMDCKVKGCTGVDAGRGHVYETTRGNTALGTGPTWNQNQIHRHSSDGLVKTSLDGQQELTEDTSNNRTN